MTKSVPRQNHTGAGEHFAEEVQNGDRRQDACAGRCHVNCKHHWEEYEKCEKRVEDKVSMHIPRISQHPKANMGCGHTILLVRRAPANAHRGTWIICDALTFVVRQVTTLAARLPPHPTHIVAARVVQRPRCCSRLSIDFALLVCIWVRREGIDDLLSISLTFWVSRPYTLFGVRSQSRLARLALTIPTALHTARPCGTSGAGYPLPGPPTPLRLFRLLGF